MRALGNVALLAACAAAILVVESDVASVADLAALGAVDLVFLAFYSLLLYGLVRFAVRQVGRMLVRSESG